MLPLDRGVGELQPYIQKMNKAEKEDLEKHGFVVDLQGNIEETKPKTNPLWSKVRQNFLGYIKSLLPQYNRQRRILLKVSALSGPVYATGLLPDLIKPKEAEQKVSVSSQRVNTQLIFSSLQSAAQFFVSELNERWKRFAEEHELESPKVLEGYYTKFGPSSISRGQLLEVTNDIAEKITNGTLEERKLSRRQRRLMLLRRIFDQKNIESRYYVASPEFRREFASVLKEQGYDGVIAMKSPEDLGRTGTLQVWNKLEERWSDPMRVIVLNTATYQTWNGKREGYSQLNDFCGSYEGEMRWMLELSDEVISQGGTSLDVINNTSGFASYIDDEVPINYQIDLPQYRREELLLHPNTLSLVHNLQITFDRDFPSELQEYSQNLPEKFLYSIDGLQMEANMDMDSYLVYLIYHIYESKDRESKLHFFHGSLNNLRNSLTMDTSGYGSGLPIGRLMIHELFKYLYLGGKFEKNILTEKYESGLVEGNSVFFVESYEAGSLSILQLGFITKKDGQNVFHILDKKRELKELSTQEMTDTYLKDKPLNRVVSYTIQDMHENKRKDWSFANDLPLTTQEKSERVTDIPRITE